MKPPGALLSHRFRRSRLPLVLLAAVFILVFPVEDGEAANTRVSISNFAWSKDPEIDLGESVTWDWLGPDTTHSVTGTGPGGLLIDSDLGSSFPRHAPGDTFAVSFSEAGSFTFACKIHSAVRGTVSVSNMPGDPDSDPGPQPPVFFDGEAPDLREARLSQTILGPGGKGTGLVFAVDERATADADYFRLVERGRGTVRKFAGFGVWKTFIGYNRVRFAARTKSFRARPGRYVALLRVTDDSNNASRPVPLRFDIRKPARPGGRAQSSG